MAVIISRAKIGDSKAILRLEQKAWKEKDVSSKYDIATTIRFGYAFVAKHRGKIVGAILARSTSDGSVYVEDWFVDPKHRGEGVGTRLYKALIAATRLPILTLVRPDFKESLEAHKKLGFKIVRRIKDPYGLGESTHRLLMKRKCSPIA